MVSLSNPLLRIISSIGVFVVGLCIIYTTWTVPNNFPVGKNFIIEEGESLRSVSFRLEEGNYIHSALFFRIWVSFLGRDRHMQLGEYVFNEKQSLGSLVTKLVITGPDIPLVSVTIPEGSTTHEVALLFRKSLSNFSVTAFEEKVAIQKISGKLFPSTYFLLPSTDENRAIEIMTKTFDKKYNDSFEGIPIMPPLFSQKEVLSLASILEGEAKTKEDMHIVSGILQSRMTLGIPLQVDVAKETYRSRGLPEQPINNPGLVAMFAVFSPVKTPYLYYITGKDGTMHYAKTFDEHKRNIQKYLR